MEEQVPQLKAPIYQFQTWWGGVTVSPERPLIHSKVQEIRRRVGGLVAKKGTGAAFPVKSAKDLMEKFRAALDETNCTAYVSKQDVKDKDPERGTLCVVQSTVRVCAEDGSFVEFIGVGHGADTQDKAAGKASTYAWKDALVKGLDLPDAEMVDTDDSGDPIPGGVAKGKGGAKAKVETKESVKESAAELLAQIEACVESSKLQAMMSTWASTLSRDVAVQVAPVAKLKLLKLKEEGK